MMLRGGRVLLLLVLILILGAAYTLSAPYGPSTETLVTISPGTATARIADELQSAGIIRSAAAFKLLRLLKRGTLHAGEYRFDHPATPAEIYSRLVRGDVYTRGLSIPEGFNIFDIAQAVQTAGLGSREAFLAAERQHTELIAEWSPHAQSLEGFLFPATYRFSPHATPEQMLAVMVRRFRQAAKQLDLHDNIAQTVTMASLIEKEVGQDAERPLVASVFHNRMARGMALETDPTVIYAALLDNRYRGTIYRSDLQAPSLYNTYKHTGLPPGPICNPSLASLRAALAPAQSNSLYFVSDGQGHTRFSTTRAEHEEQVRNYRTVEQVRLAANEPAPLPELPPLLRKQTKRTAAHRHPTRRRSRHSG